jgi:3-hydroxyisobutyrate dehydrogenase-like beta-hydroxyacid dehydrogenase
MNLKKLGTTALAVFFIGLGLAAGTAQARPLCSQCDASYQNCRAHGGSDATCSATLKRCYANCLQG